MTLRRLWTTWVQLELVCSSSTTFTPWLPEFGTTLFKVISFWLSNGGLGVLLPMTSFRNSCSVASSSTWDDSCTLRKWCDSWNFANIKRLIATTNCMHCLCQFFIFAWEVMEKDNLKSTLTGMYSNGLMLTKILLIIMWPWVCKNPCHCCQLEKVLTFADFFEIYLWVKDCKITPWHPLMISGNLSNA